MMIEKTLTGRMQWHGWSETDTSNAERWV